MMTLQLHSIIGHRGASGYAPENTLISMQKAYELGARWVEFDVMLAGCGEPIIMHDYTLERTTNGKGVVEEMDIQALSKLDCGSWFSHEFKGEKIPTLALLLQHLAPLKLGINIELKPTIGKEQQTALAVLTELENYWPGHCPVPLISSFSTCALKSIFEQNKYINLGLIIDYWQDNWSKIVDQFKGVSLHVNHAILTPERVDQVKKTGRHLLAYTVNHKERAKELIDWGVDAVFTDYPDLLNPLR